MAPPFSDIDPLSRGDVILILIPSAITWARSLNTCVVTGAGTSFGVDGTGIPTVSRASKAPPGIPGASDVAGLA